MKTNLTVFILLTTFLATLLCTGCNEKTEIESIANDKAVLAIEDLKTDIISITEDYANTYNTTTRARWWRWLIFGVSDAVGFAVGGLDGGIAASTLVWSVTKKEKMESENQMFSDPSLQKSDNVLSLPLKSAGYIHNEAILETYKTTGEALFEMPADKQVELLCNQTEIITGIKLSDAEKKGILKIAKQITDVFDPNMTVDQYVSKLQGEFPDKETQSIIVILGTVVKGLENVSQSEDAYLRSITSAIEESSVAIETKNILTESVSIAHGSSKLWNAQAIIK